MVGTISGGTADLYVDGVLKATTETSLSGSSGDLYIGSRGGCDTFYQGSMSEALYFQPRALQQRDSGDLRRRLRDLRRSRLGPLGRRPGTPAGTITGDEAPTPAWPSSPTEASSPSTRTRRRQLSYNMLPHNMRGRPARRKHRRRQPVLGDGPHRALRRYGRPRWNDVRQHRGDSEHQAPWRCSPRAAVSTSWSQDASTARRFSPTPWPGTTPMAASIHRSAPTTAR